MKNLLKCTLGVIAATVALAVLASAAIAATPALSPVPTACTSACEEQGSFGSGAGGTGHWSGYLGSGLWSGLSVPTGATFHSWNEGTELHGLRLTFEQDEATCVNEGRNFTTEPLKGRFGVVEGQAVVLLEPETGSTIGKCTDHGAPVELTGSVIAQVGSAEGKVTLTFTGGTLQRLTALEPAHVILASVEGSKGSEVSWTGATTLPAHWEIPHEPAPAVHIAGRTATFSTPMYAGGFELSGGAMTFVSKWGTKITCKYASGAGRFTSATGGYLYLGFTSCKGALNCTATGWGSLRKLKVQLAYTYPATETPEGRQVALVLSPETGEIVNEFECGGVKFANRGSVIAPISPLAKSSSTFALNLKQEGGVQEHLQYEGAGGESLWVSLYTSIEESKWEQSGIEVKTPSVYLNAGGVETIK